MSRLIDADEVVKAVHDEFDECLVWDESGATTADEFENIILQLPTVDAVEVVRCKDCFHFWDGVCKAHNDVIYVDDNDFCSWGKRREEEEKRKKMPTVNIKDIPESKTVRLVDLSEDSINKIAEAVARKIAIDGAEVIRCKNCKWWNSDEETCIENGGLWRASDFCSWAERRKNDK